MIVNITRPLNRRYHGGRQACGANQTIDAHSFVDVNLRKTLNENVDIYVGVENLLDDEDVVARAPKDGARSQKPRTMKVGFALNF